MKKSTKIAAIAAAATSALVSGAAVVLAAAPTVPAEQTALVEAGYAKVANWGKFVKDENGCKTTIMLSGDNYYVSTSGKLKSTLYPVRPTHVVDGADLLTANCQG